MSNKSIENNYYIILIDITNLHIFFLLNISILDHLFKSEDFNFNVFTYIFNLKISIVLI